MKAPGEPKHLSTVAGVDVGMCGARDVRFVMRNKDCTCAACLERATRPDRRAAFVRRAAAVNRGRRAAVANTWT
jgi:hypothetical protein